LAAAVVADYWLPLRFGWPTRFTLNFAARIALRLILGAALRLALHLAPLLVIRPPIVALLALRALLLWAVELLPIIPVERDAARFTRDFTLIGPALQVALGIASSLLRRSAIVSIERRADAITFRPNSFRFALVAGDSVAPLTLTLIVSPVVRDSRSIVARPAPLRRADNAFNRVRFAATLNLAWKFIRTAYDSSVVPIATSVALIEVAAIELIGSPDARWPRSFIAHQVVVATI
jgi:hypothetical protein